MKNRKKQVIRLTESELNRVIKESVNKVLLKEWEYAGWVNDIGDDVDYDLADDNEEEPDTFEYKVWCLQLDLGKYMQEKCDEYRLYFNGFGGGIENGNDIFHQGFITSLDTDEVAEVTIKRWDKNNPTVG